jgi:hypothetical protein
MRKRPIDHKIAGRLTCRVAEWSAATGIGKSKTYELIDEGRLETRHVDGITLIVVASGLRLLGLDRPVLNSQPPE